MGETILEKSRRQASEARRMSASRRADNGASNVPEVAKHTVQSKDIGDSDNAVCLRRPVYATGEALVDLNSTVTSLLSKEVAIAAVRKLHEGVSAGFVPRKYVNMMDRKGLKLKSSFYGTHFLLATKRKLLHALWAFCPYYADGFCVIKN
jgi:hypothetical protein